MAIQHHRLFWHWPGSRCYRPERQRRLIGQRNNGRQRGHSVLCRATPGYTGLNQLNIGLPAGSLPVPIRSLSSERDRQANSHNRNQVSRIRTRGAASAALRLQLSWRLSTHTMELRIAALSQALEPSPIPTTIMLSAVLPKFKRRLSKMDRD